MTLLNFQALALVMVLAWLETSSGLPIKVREVRKKGGKEKKRKDYEHERDVNNVGLSYMSVMREKNVFWPQGYEGKK